jgi:hypothetical protein
VTEARHRDFPGRRWLINGLRALHLVGVVGVGAGVLGGLPAPAWQGYAWLLGGSGIGILALDRWSNSAYLYQVNGLSILGKLAVLVLFLLVPESREAVFWVILLFSVLLTHAPGQLRHRVVCPSRKPRDR